MPLSLEDALRLVEGYTAPSATSRQKDMLARQQQEIHVRRDRKCCVDHLSWQR
jgi:hypothetical protein